jgi:hypothetical protein
MERALLRIAVVGTIPIDSDGVDEAKPGKGVSLPLSRTLIAPAAKQTNIIRTKSTTGKRLRMNIPVVNQEYQKVARIVLWATLTCNDLV